MGLEVELLFIVVVGGCWLGGRVGQVWGVCERVEGEEDMWV